jgi:hypothetical protein
MPSMANITVKKNDGTTDIVYDALSPAGGDVSPAVWRQDTGALATLPLGLRPQLRMQCSWNGPKTARVVKATFRYPYAVQDTTTQLWSAPHWCILDVSGVLPTAFNPAALNEAVAQGFNLFASSLFKTSSQAGYAPT